MAALAPDMPDAIATSSSADMEESALDDEISSIRAQIRSLTSRRSTLTSTLLSQPATQSLLRSRRQRNGPTSAHTTRRTANPSNSIDQQQDSSPLLTTALALSEEQASHNVQNLYRLGAGITAFEVADPDPNAVDNGRVLGVRIEVFVKGSFLTPYYLLLTRPYASHPMALKVHHHTIPAHIALQTLISTYLPPPPRPSGSDVADHTSTPIKPAPPGRPQDLSRLVRSLRTELVRYHYRATSSDLLREKVGLVNEDPTSQDDNADEAISALTKSNRARNTGGNEGRAGVSAIDTAHDLTARSLRISWRNGRLARLSLDDEAAVESCVVYRPTGARSTHERHAEAEGGSVDRDWEMERLIKRAGWIGGLAAVLSGADSPVREEMDLEADAHMETEME